MNPFSKPSTEQSLKPTLQPAAIGECFGYGESYSKSRALNVSPRTYLIPMLTEEFRCSRAANRQSAVKTPSRASGNLVEKKGDVCEGGQVRSHVRDRGVCGEQLGSACPRSIRSRSGARPPRRARDTSSLLLPARTPLKLSILA